MQVKKDALSHGYNYFVLGIKEEQSEMHPRLSHLLNGLKTFSLIMQDYLQNLGSIKLLAQIFPDSKSDAINLNSFFNLLGNIFTGVSVIHVEKQHVYTSKTNSVSMLSHIDPFYDYMRANAIDGIVKEVKFDQLEKFKILENLIEEVNNYSILKIYSDDYKEASYMLVGQPKKWSSECSKFLLEIYKNASRLIQYYISVTCKNVPIKNEFNLAFFISRFMVAFMEFSEEILLEKCRLLLEAEFNVPCSFNSGGLSLSISTMKSRHFSIKLLKDDIIEATVIDSKNKVDLFLFSFMLSHLLKQTKEKISLNAQALSLADLVFSSSKCGMILSPDDEVLHIHRKIEYDISEYFDLASLSQNNLCKTGIKFNRLLKKRDVVEEILNQKYIASEENSKVIVKKRGNLLFVFFDSEFPMMNQDSTVRLSSPVKAKKFKDIMKKIKDYKKSDLDLRRKSILNMLGNYENDKHFKAFAPGVSNISKDNIEILKDSILSIYIDSASSLSNFASVKKQLSISSQLTKFEEMKIEMARKHQKVIPVSFKDLEYAEFPLDDWFVDLTSKDPEYLTNFVSVIFKKMGFQDTYKFEESRFSSFISNLRFYYTFHSNPFHNFNHGVAVCHAMYYLVTATRLSKLLDPLTKFAAIVAALSHDAGHRGKTNDYEISSYSVLAVRYNDVSVLENYHSTLLFEILRENESNILSEMDGTDFRKFRKVAIECILATDMKRHKLIIQDITDDKETFTQSREVLPDSKQIAISSFLTHVVDLNGAAKKFDVCIKWSNMLREEFKCQYNEESEFDLPQTPYFKDLDNEAVFLKGELFFQKCIIKELYETANLVLDGDLDFVCKEIDSNIGNIQEKYEIEDKLKKS